MFASNDEQHLAGADPDGDTPDYDPQVHEGGQSMADDRLFEPGPSFVEDDRPTERLTEMPAWLQTFAAAAMEDDEEPSGEPTATEPERPSSDNVHRTQGGREPSLPDWLQADGLQAQAGSSVQVETLEAFDDFASPQSSGADPFISEDDLPDWLRAFSEETSHSPAMRAPATTAPSMSSSTSPAGTAMVRVPPVENIWLSTYERQALGPGPTLFALLASSGNGDVSYADAPSYDRHAVTAVDSGSTRAQAATGEQPAAVSVSEPQAAEQRNSLRPLLITLLVVAVLVFVSLLFLT